jgi:hypothetical protein
MDVAAEQWANGSGICTPTDLGTYNDFIKPYTSVNNVFYHLDIT